MRKICITFIMISIMMVSFALPCGADLNEDITLPMEFYGPPWDINHEGVTNIYDVSRLVYHYSEEGIPGWIREDVIRNGKVDIYDVSIVVYHYGERWLVP